MLHDGQCAKISLRHHPQTLVVGPLRLNAIKQQLGRLRSSCGLWDALDLDDRVEHLIWRVLSPVTG